MIANEHTATINGKDLPISTKHAVEICKFIKGKSLQKSRQMLQAVIEKKRAVPFTRYKKDMGHKPGRIAAGRYPEKASKCILKLINSLEANAQNKGLDADGLVLTTLIANRGSRPWHFGRLRRRKTKRTHIMIVAEEQSKEKTKPQQKQQPRGEVQKQ